MYSRVRKIGAVASMYLVAISDESNEKGNYVWPDLCMILRAIAMQNSSRVANSAQWCVAYLDIHAYGDIGGIYEYAQAAIAPGTEMRPDRSWQMDGKSLLMASALIHQTEECLLFQVSDIGLSEGTQFGRSQNLSGKAAFHSTNSDLEIRLGGGPWEVITTDKDLAEFLKAWFGSAATLKESL